VANVNQAADTLEPAAPRRLRAGGVFRALNKCVPLGRRYHRFLELVNPKAGLVAIPFGKFEVVHPASWGSEVAAILFFGENLMPEFRLLPPILKELKSGHLVDVGANIGLYTLMFREHSNLPIIAYEPQPFLWSLVERNVAHNKLKEVEVRHIACGSERGEVSFQTGINGGVVAGGDGHTESNSEAHGTVDEEAAKTRHVRPVVKVPVTTLDIELANIPVALLKIDCEGFEHRILAGAMKVLEKQRPILLLEVHPQEIVKLGGSVGEVLKMLQPVYDLEFWDFYPQRTKPRIVRSVMKNFRPRGHRLANEQEMLKACETDPKPYQVYFLGRPKRAAK
jgi:FkbM family methyltransferase